MPEKADGGSEPSPVTTAPKKRSHHKKPATPTTAAAADPPAPPARKRGEHQPRTKPEGWVARGACGTLLVPKPLIAKLKTKAKENKEHLWQLVHRVLEKAAG